MKKTAIAMVFIAASARAADIVVVRGGDTFNISNDTVITGPFTNPQANVPRGGYLSIDAAPSTVSVGDNVTFQNITTTTSGTGAAIKALNGLDIGDYANFTNNSATSNSYSGGGALYIRLINPGSATTQPDNPNVDIGNNASFQGNSADHTGGAILLEYGNLNIGENAEFSGNSAAAGGAISIIKDPSNGDATPSAVIGAGATFSGNSATNEGGAIFSLGSITLLTTETNGATFTTGSDSIYLYGDAAIMRIEGGGKLTSLSSLGVINGAVADIGTSEASFAGEVEFSAGSTLAIGINSADEYGFIRAGSWKISDGANIKATVANGAIGARPLAFNFLRNMDDSANASAAAAFGPLYFDNNLYSFEYDAATGLYTVSREASPMDIAAANGADAGVAAAWADRTDAGDSLGARMARRLDLLAQHDAQGYAAAIGSLGKNPTRKAEEAAYLASSLGLAAHRGADPNKNASGAGMAGFGYGAGSSSGAWAKAFHSGATLGGGDFSGTGMAGGIEAFAGSIRGGAGYAFSNMEDGAGENSAAARQFFAHISGGGEFLSASFSASAGEALWSERKDIAGMAVNSSSRARTFASQAAGEAKFGGYATSIFPLLGARYNFFSADGYSDGAGQAFEGFNAETARAIAGARIEHEAVSPSGFRASASLYAGAVQELFRDEPDEITARVENGGSYSLPVQAMGKRGFEGELSLALSSGNDATVSLSYRYENIGGFFSQEAAAKLKAIF
ncbi:MAG: autotransporter outer membrane beta-barrel domain-containing protein [Rickettsiales bacterium]|jgi:predicted outer membrane repeat protein|nr:autotransporter outer membrane beta-barrel domain-containing protein [Rickettsiales bacterium]